MSQFEIPTRLESERLVLRMFREDDWRGYRPYALEDKASGALVGAAGLWFPADFPEREIKWALLPECQGQGYASEAARAVQTIAAEVYPGLPPISFIHRDNEASIRVARAVGATLENEVDFRGARFQIYRHPARRKKA